MECGNGKADRADRFPTTEGVVACRRANESGKVAQVFAALTFQPYEGLYSALFAKWNCEK